MPETYEFEVPCDNCHYQRPMYIGVSGIDSEGTKLAYRCPDCGTETCDILPDVDDIFPKEIAWARHADGEIEWFNQSAPNIACTGQETGAAKSDGESTSAVSCQ